MYIGQVGLWAELAKTTQSLTKWQIMKWLGFGLYWQNDPKPNHMINNGVVGLWAALAKRPLRPKA